MASGLTKRAAQVRQRREQRLGRVGGRGNGRSRREVTIDPACSCPGLGIADGSNNRTTRESGASSARISSSSSDRPAAQAAICPRRVSTNSSASVIGSIVRDVEVRLRKGLRLSFEDMKQPARRRKSDERRRCRGRHADRAAPTPTGSPDRRQSRPRPANDAAAAASPRHFQPPCDRPIHGGRV